MVPWVALVAVQEKQRPFVRCAPLEPACGETFQTIAQIILQLPILLPVLCYFAKHTGAAFNPPVATSATFVAGCPSGLNEHKLTRSLGKTGGLNSKSFCGSTGQYVCSCKDWSIRHFGPHELSRQEHVNCDLSNYNWNTLFLRRPYHHHSDSSQGKQAAKQSYLGCDCNHVTINLYSLIQ